MNPRSLAKSVLGNIWRSVARATLRRLGRDNTLTIQQTAYPHIRFEGRGAGNTVNILDGAVLHNVTITIRGSKNTITIGPHARMRDGHIWAEGDGCAIEIGEATTFEPGVKLAAVEDGSRITIGRDSMFSEDVQVRTSDSHGIWADGVRTNPARDVTIGAHVWVGNGAFVLKGVRIPNDSIVGARSVVTRGTDEPRVVLAGFPAQIVRTGASWTRDRDTAPAT